MWKRIEDALLDWESALIKKLAHVSTEHRIEDLKWVEEQIPRIEEEMKLASLRIHKLEELIAKARALLVELENSECKVLTGGDDMHQVGAFLKEKFGGQLEKNYSQGRKTMCAALEEHYHISPNAACEVLALLKEAKIVRFTMRHEPGLEVPPTPYPAEEEVVIYDEIFMSPASTGPALKAVWEIG